METLWEIEWGFELEYEMVFELGQKLEPVKASEWEQMLESEMVSVSEFGWEPALVLALEQSLERMLEQHLASWLWEPEWEIALVVGKVTKWA